MTRLFNDPANFADELVEGFVAAHRRWVRRVSGGVIRSTRPVRPTVAVVTGGGSGHYPAFAGYVGAGLAHGAAMGNLFASPSAAQVYGVARAVEHGAGVIFVYGNYAGDVLHFSDAENRLRADGVDVRTVTVTDDVASAASTERHKRRGIAGDVVVLKVAGAAAATGYDLDSVQRVTSKANERTRSFGVAFGGCTLPGASAPLFTVPAGKVALGLGIHGEPGFAERPVPTADDLAVELVDRLLAELPDGVADVDGTRVGLILNGLGAVKYEELFVVYRAVDRLLSGRGVAIVEPEVGELVTSFDMAGLSLTLVWLDEELERMWTAPADAPAFAKGTVIDDPPAPEPTAEQSLSSVGPASQASQEVASKVVAVLVAMRDVIDEQVDELGRIDAVAGDGDHGIGMQRGVTAAAAAAAVTADRGAGAGTVLRHAAQAWSDRAGGTSGSLWGLILRTLGDRFGDQSRPRPIEFADAVQCACRAVIDVGRAAVGDKTMVDALVPFADTLSAGTALGRPLGQAWAAAAEAAAAAAAATAGLLPRMGRARPHAEKSLGVPDAGAVSLGLIVRAVATAAFPLPV